MFNIKTIPYLCFNGFWNNPAFREFGRPSKVNPQIGTSHTLNFGLDLFLDIRKANPQILLAEWLWPQPRKPSKFWKYFTFDLKSSQRSRSMTRFLMSEATLGNPSTDKSKLPKTLCGHVCICDYTSATTWLKYPRQDIYHRTISTCNMTTDMIC